MREVIELTSGKDITLNIEIKAPLYSRASGIERKLINIIKEYGVLGNTIVSSFNHYSLVRMREFEPEIVTAPLYAGVFVDPF